MVFHVKRLGQYNFLSPRGAMCVPVDVLYLPFFLLSLRSITSTMLPAKCKGNQEQLTPFGMGEMSQHLFWESGCRRKPLHACYTH